ncbi:MAG: DUF485 domain-containing protein [Candidatus Bipolaricaulota bacterium]|nr:MAG: DUF485 domain-containing protein [Candidatus Bipolaricaulota bacterium]
MSNDKAKETERYVAREFRKSFSLGIFFLVVTLILPILNQFAGGFMLRKLFGELSVTYLYSVLFIYIVAWVITVYYVLRTDREEEEH